MIKFGILGTANITSTALLKPAAENSKVEITVIGSRNRDRAASIAATENIPIVANDYQAVIDHPEINAIYIPLPISHHREWAIKALRAGKHVLCEKSLTCNHNDAKTMAIAAKESKRMLVEAFHYRYHPVFLRALELYRQGSIGELLQLNCVFHVPITDPDDIRMHYETGGGATMDIGCYPLSWVRHFSGEEPEIIGAEAIACSENIDLKLTADLQLPNGAKATISGSMLPEEQYTAYIEAIGSKGKMYINNPLSPQRGHSIQLDNEAGRKTETLTTRSSYSFQLDAFVNAIEQGISMPTDAEDAVRQLQLIDSCYRSSGLPLRVSKEATTRCQ